MIKHHHHHNNYPQFSEFHPGISGADDIRINKTQCVTLRIHYLINLGILLELCTILENRCPNIIQKLRLGLKKISEYIITHG